MNVAQYVLARLREVGATHVFTVPGDYCKDFISALDADAHVERIATVNELGAGYAADGYGRVKGVGALCVQYGVGSFSALNCVAGSFVERVPVVLISASPTKANRQQELRQNVLFHHSTGDLRVDQEVFRHVTVASLVLDDAGAAPDLVDRAFVAMLQHSRPIYIEALQDIWAASCRLPNGPLVVPPAESDPAALKTMLDAAWPLLQSARAPVIWGGVEIGRFGLTGPLQDLVRRSGMPFTTTSLGKTILDEGQRQFIGTYAGPASPESTWNYLNAADCILALGTIVTDDYLNIVNTSYDKMIMVTDEEARIGYARYANVTMRDFIAGLLQRFEAGGRHEWPMPPAPPPFPIPAPDARLTYNSFAAELTEWMRAEKLFGSSHLILGESTSLYVLGNVFGMPANSFVANAAWGSLGHETGAALGTMLGSGKRAFVVAGDGGFRMICQELSSLEQARQNAIVFVMSNNAYAIEQAFVSLDAFKPGGSFAAFDLLPEWDYCSLAQAFGAVGRRVTTAGELREALKAAQNIKDCPMLVEVVIDQKDLAPQLYRLAATPP